MLSRGLLEMGITAELPEDLIGAILMKVPIKPLMRFKTVSKNWHRLINSQPFAFRRPRRITSLFVLRQQLIDYRPRFQDSRNGSYVVPVSVRGRHVIRKHPKFDLQLTNDKLSFLFPAGYGIICFFEFFTGTVSLWNPTTDQTTVLPLSPYHPSGGTCCYKFAIVEDCNDGTFSYKVGRIRYEKVHSDSEIVYLDGGDDQYSLSLELYSSKTKSWKFISEFYTGGFSGYSDPFRHCTNLNGKAHWVAQSPNNDDTYVTAFDYETEVFTRIKAPSRSKVGSCYDKSRCLVTLLDEKFLCLGLYEVKDDRTSFLDIWVLRQYGVEDSWIKEFTVGPLEKHMQVVGFSSKLQCVFLRDKLFLGDYLLLCDCKSSKITKRVLIGNPEHRHEYRHMQVVEHFKSPVSLVN